MVKLSKESKKHLAVVFFIFALVITAIFVIPEQLKKPGSYLYDTAASKQQQFELAATSKKYYSFISGTGFYVTNSHIITNAHVVKGCKFIRIKGPQIRNSTAKLFVADKTSDLALLKTDVKPKRIASLRAKSEVSIGERLTVMGYPKRRSVKGKYVVKKAEVLDTSDPFFSEDRVVFTDSVEKGNSGGPLLDNNGNVIGVIVGKVSYYLTDTSTSNLKNAKPYKTSSVAIDLKSLKKFLNRNNIFYKLDSTSPSIKVYDPVRRARNFLVNIHCIQKESDKPF